MKKTTLLLTAAAVMFTTAEAKDKKKNEVKTPVVEAKVFNNDVDSMSYSLGVNVGTDFGKSLKSIPGGKSNIDLIIKGFATAMKGDSTLIKKDDATQYLRAYITKAQTADIEKKKLEAQQFLANNMTKEGVKTTASGLQYLVMKEGTGVKPQEKDTVEVHYTGSLIDGTVFDSSVKRGQPITFPLNQVIKGWTEGVQLMPVGSKYKFFIPYTLGYGEQGAGQTIPGYSTLVFEVELLSVKAYKEPVAPVVKKEDAAKKVSKKGAVKSKK